MRTEIRTGCTDVDETVEVVIKKDGSVEIHVTGIHGTACLTTTEELVELLGGQIESQELTAEAYNQAYGSVDESQEQQDRLWH